MDLPRLVRERKEGSLDRRQFLARLGATAAGATAASVVSRARPAGAQKKVTVTMWDTEPNPATRAAVSSSEIRSRGPNSTPSGSTGSPQRATTAERRLCGSSALSALSRPSAPSSHARSLRPSTSSPVPWSGSSERMHSPRKARNSAATATPASSSSPPG